MNPSRTLLCQEVTFGTHPLESRKSDAVEMDEMMAAMVLTSLSCSPVVQSPPGAEANFSGEEGGPLAATGCGASPPLAASAWTSPLPGSRIARVSPRWLLRLAG